MMYAYVKKMHAELTAAGFPADTTMVMLMDAMMLIAQEQGEAGAVQAVMERMGRS